MWHTCVGGNQISLTPYILNSEQKMEKNSTKEYEYMAHRNISKSVLDLIFLA